MTQEQAKDWRCKPELGNWQVDIVALDRCLLGYPDCKLVDAGEHADSPTMRFEIQRRLNVNEYGRIVITVTAKESAESRSTLEVMFKRKLDVLLT